MRTSAARTVKGQGAADPAEEAEVRSQVPHPIPYQGSKRALAPRILALVQGQHFEKLYEPFAGSAALTLAASKLRIADKFVIADSLSPLVALWKQIVSKPDRLASEYEEIWRGQTEGDTRYYFQVRDEYNRTGGPARLLYLLARCVKNSPRFNGEGLFNQSADKRRLGMRPEKMRRELSGASALLSGRSRILGGDFEATLKSASGADLVYLDPPWQGTTDGPHKRYHQGLSRDRLISALEDLNSRRIPFLLSYDGRCGDKTYGEPLPARLRLTHMELHAGRSSQATLAGRSEDTVESLYISPALARRVGSPSESPRQRQLALWG